MKSFILNITLVTAGLLIPVSAAAQLADTTGLSGRLVDAPTVYKTETRAIALGNATIADPYSNASMNLNPALLSFAVFNRSFNIHSNQNWDNLLVYHSMTFPAVRLGRHHIALQTGIHHQSTDDFNFLTDRKLTDPDIAVFQIDAGYAFKISDGFSVGAFQNVTHARNKNGQYWTYYANLGLIYNPVGTVSYAAVFRGLGRSPTYEFLENDLTILGSQALRQSLEIGATIRYPDQTALPYLAISFSNEKRFGEDGMWYKAGVEAIPIPLISIRSGLLFKPEDQLYIPRFGLGLNLAFISLDYAASHRSVYGEHFHQVGIMIKL
jgi:hypothetical protein